MRDPMLDWNNGGYILFFKVFLNMYKKIIFDINT